MSDYKGIDLLKINPTDLVNRYIVAYTIRNAYTPMQVLEFNPNFVVDMFDENDQPVIEMDWEYYFFVATNPEVQHLIAQLHDKYSPSKQGQSIVDPDKDDTLVKKIISLQEQDEIDRHNKNNPLSKGNDLIN